jgi:hypothetical protein
MMRAFVSKLPMLVLLSTLVASCSEEQSAEVDNKAKAQSADTVYTNGKIYTVNEKQPWAEAVAIKDGKFLVVGSNADVKAVTGEDTKVIDLGGKMAMPGLMDVHVHPFDKADFLANLDIKNPANADAILEELRKYAEANPDLPVIRGGSWNLGVFPNDSPRKELLDEIVPDRPVYLVSQTGHSAWANSKALELAGITKDTEKTDTFIFDTDSETGEPSGTVREFAMGAVVQALPKTTPKKLAPAIKTVLSEFNAFGFTTLKPAEGARNWIEGAALLETQGGLTARLFPSWDWRSHYMPTSIEVAKESIANWKDLETELIKPGNVKMFFDGGPDSYTALLLEDYEGRPGFKGQLNLPKEQFLKEISDFNAKGIGAIVHVIGDGGSRELMDIFEKVRSSGGDEGALLHFSHAWLTRPEDFKRLAQIKGVCLDFSPALSYPAAEIEGSMAPPIGEARYQTFFNAKSAFDAFGEAKDIHGGIPIGFGSDWPSALIPDPNGFHQMQAWITRANPEDPSSRKLNPDEAISLEQAIHGFTLGGAHCLGRGWEKKVGSIEVGKLADFIVLDRNLFEVPIEDLWKTKVDLTVLSGKQVYDRSAGPVDDIINEEAFKPGSRYVD